MLERGNELMAVKRREMAAIWVELVLNLTIFTIFMFNVALIESGGIFVLFPLVAVASFAALYYARKTARLEDWSAKSVTKLGIDGVVFIILAVGVGIAVTNAVLARFAVAGLPELIPPAMFVIALGIRACYNLGMFVYYALKARSATAAINLQEEPIENNAGNTQALISHGFGFIIPAFVVLGVGFALLAHELNLAFLGMIGAGIGVLFVGYKYIETYLADERAHNLLATAQPLLQSPIVSQFSTPEVTVVRQSSQTDAPYEGIIATPVQDP